MANVTPDRNTQLLLDGDEFALVDPAWQVSRRGADIAPAAFSGQSVNPNQNNVTYWKSTGAITLRPIQDEISGITEYNDSYSLVVRASQMTLVDRLVLGTAVSIIQEQPFWKKAPLLNAFYSSNIAAQGDVFLVKRVPAGAGWDNALTGSGSAPAETSTDVPMDRVGVSNDPYPANQGFFLRFRLRGAAPQSPRFIWSYKFGQYTISFGGSGDVTLYEDCNATEGGDAVTRVRDRWKYARPSQISNQYHTIGIWPHYGPKGERYLSFVNNALDISAQASTQTTTNTSQQSPSEHLYQPDKTPRPDGFGGQDQDMSPGQITAAGIFAFDIRRDLRVDVQISTWGWATTGTLIDQPAEMPDHTDTADNPVYAQMAAVVPDTCELTPVLYDANTGGLYDFATRRMQAAFYFLGDGTSTPTLWGYHLRRPATVQIVSPGAFACDVHGVNLVGPSGEPSQETGSVIVKDIQGLAPRLSNRGQLAAKVVTYDPYSDSYVILFQGYALRPVAEQRAPEGRRQGAFGLGDPVEYPSPDWRNYQIPLMGMWQRLQEIDYLGHEGARILMFGNSFTSPYEYPDQSAVNTLVPGAEIIPWRVTDAIRDLLYQAGFTPDQVNIPDCAVRLWASTAEKAQENVVNARTNLADMIVGWCTNYLGVSLLWSANDGDNGQWTISWPPPILAEGDTNQYLPLWNFFTTSDGGWIDDVASATVMIGMPSFSIVPPEFNAIRVATGVAGASGDYVSKSDRFVYNPISFECPGFSVLPDPDHPDYLGRFRCYTVIDATLSDPDPAITQYAIDFTARRLYDVLCHAQRTATFRAPLVFCNDPITGARRTLRHNDPISIDGDASWVVKSVNPEYSHDSLQTASYEVIQPIGRQVFHDGLDGLSFYRKTQKRMALRSTGHSTGSHLSAGQSVTPGAEQKILSLPSSDYARGPLQMPDGSFYPLGGFDAQYNLPA